MSNKQPNFDDKAFLPWSYRSRKKRKQTTNPEPWSLQKEKHFGSYTVSTFKVNNSRKYSKHRETIIKLFQKTGKRVQTINGSTTKAPEQKQISLEGSSGQGAERVGTVVPCLHLMVEQQQGCQMPLLDTQVQLQSMLQFRAPQPLIEDRSSKILNSVHFSALDARVSPPVKKCATISPQFSSLLDFLPSFGKGKPISNKRK